MTESGSYSSNSVNLRVSLRALTKLQERVGVSDGRSVQQVARDESAREEEERRVAALTPYQRSEYVTANAIRELRETMRTYQDMEDGIPRRFDYSDIARCRQKMRKQEVDLSRMGKDVMRLARAEKKESDARELQKHIDGARQYYRQRFRLVTTGGDGSQSDVDHTINSPSTSSPAFHRSNDAAPLLGGDGGAPLDFGTSLRSDGEFQVFFDTLMKQDHIMDKQLDRIHEGVLRLRENADLITNELKVQSVLIDDTEAKVDRVHAKMVTLNKRLKETLKQVDSSRMCLYMFCFLIVLGIVGGVLYETGVLGGSSSKH